MKIQKILSFLLAGALLGHTVPAQSMDARPAIEGGLSYANTALTTTGKSLEKSFRNVKHLPQYKYVARPIYKAFGGSEWPLISVPASFILTDLIMHKLAIAIIAFSMSKDRRDRWISNPNIVLRDMFDWRSLSTIWWLLSVPIAWHKFVELQKQKQHLKRDEQQN